MKQPAQRDWGPQQCVGWGFCAARAVFAWDKGMIKGLQWSGAGEEHSYQSSWCETSSGQPFACANEGMNCARQSRASPPPRFFIKNKVWGFLVFFYSPLNVFLDEGISIQIPEGFFSRPFQQGSLFSKVSRALWPGGKLISLSDAVQGVPLVPHPARGGLEQCWDQVFDVTLQVSRDPWEWEGRWKELALLQKYFLCPCKIFSEKGKTCLWSSFPVSIFF